MDWSNVGKAIGAAAPVLGSVLAGPPGLAVGGAVSLLLKGLGLGTDTSPEQVMESLNANPETYLKLKELESTEKLALAELEKVQLTAQLQDVASARSREVELAKVGNSAAYGPTLISIVITLGFFSTLCLLIFKVVVPEMKDILNIMVGTLGAAFVQVCNYQLGSNRGSEMKTKLLAMADSITPKVQ